jgi:hypothetical protein
VLVRTGTGDVQYRAASGLVGTYAWLLGGNSLTSVQTLGTLSNHDLPIITAGTEKVRITTTGNVGIGTSAPAQKLHVVGNVQFTGALMPAGAAGSTGQVLVSQGAGTAPQWWDITDDGSGTIVVTPGGGQITIGALNNNAIWNADRLQGNNVSSTMPMADQVLAWDGVANEWQPKSLSAGTGITLPGSRLRHRTPTRFGMRTSCRARQLTRGWLRTPVTSSPGMGRTTGGRQLRCPRSSR